MSTMSKLMAAAVALATITAAATATAHADDRDWVCIALDAGATFSDVYRTMNESHPNQPAGITNLQVLNRIHYYCPEHLNDVPASAVNGHVV